MKIKHLSLNLYVISFFLSALLTLVRYSFHQPINIDGILYINTALAYLESGIKAALLTYPWPFYSLLIGMIAKITTLDPLHSAYLLNFFFDFFTVVVFTLLIKTLGGSKRAQWIGAFVILFYPLLNRGRLDVIREHGFVLFALLGLLLLIQYAKTTQWRYAMSWTIFILLAGLFRIEAFALLYFLPIALFIRPNTTFRNRLGYLGKAYIFHVLIISAIFVYYCINARSMIWLSHFSRLADVLQQTLYGFSISWQILQAKAIIAKEQILSIFAVQDKWIFIVGGLLGIYIKQLFTSVSFPYVFMMIYGFYQKLFYFNRMGKIIWAWSLLINIIVTLIFLSQNFFITVRYLYLLSTLFLLIIPFVVEKIYLDFKSYREKISWKTFIFPLVLLGLLYGSAESFIYFGISKTYLVDAGKWIAQNFPEDNVTLCSNDEQLNFYTQLKNIQPIIINNEQDLVTFNEQAFSHCPYIAVNFDRNSSSLVLKLLQNPQLLLLKTLHNNKGAQLLIMRKIEH